MNLARGKTASQVGRFNKGMHARNAVDGDITPGSDHCSNPYAREVPYEAWWQVDLEDVYVINSVIIVNINQVGGMYV